MTRMLKRYTNKCDKMAKLVNSKLGKIASDVGSKEMVRMLKAPGPGICTRGEMVKPLSALKWKTCKSAKAKKPIDMRIA